MKVLIIDNYDSFTYNLYQYIGEILTSEKNRGAVDDFSIVVKRNDELSLAQIREMQADRIIVSPGPGSPDDEHYFGVCAQVIAELGKTTPLLGVCLGMQGIVHVFGGKVVKAPRPMHGKISPISHNRQGMFANIPDQLEVMRYHSLMAEAESFPECLQLTALVGDFPAREFDNLSRIRQGGDFEIMGIQHRDYPIFGIQFHPESFATEGGKELIRNFLFA
ncbi:MULTISPECIES: aminodeoxychorismate/anthranilate synthase component II [Spongiibacter]|uniref:anthranilate synthase component II n=1 Tax=Spongiibacter TaxID=630749 RepID=UPI000C5F3DBE|nr:MULTISPECIES: aminodeoxychorismate/anthranilate synthase component II [Spongiibacter]MAY38308.1 anthranilate/aminodeoxychorismate synthase component II [Spongiibacter sp.]MBI56843.1 anthranilate/aminodeoxychorismate synthase component II [Spongiibacter sp.]MBO6753473.1 aminodeoxychorismate/anthranilate synthase component II [Spongiibacter sp.]